MHGSQTKGKHSVALELGLDRPFSHQRSLAVEFVAGWILQIALQGQTTPTKAWINLHGFNHHELQSHPLVDFPVLFSLGCSIKRIPPGSNWALPPWGMLHVSLGSGSAASVDFAHDRDPIKMPFVRNSTCLQSCKKQVLKIPHADLFSLFFFSLIVFYKQRFG